MKGVVVSDKMAKTIVVDVTRYAKHPLYRKYVRKSKRYKVHDEKNEYRVGDKVIIQEMRPVSKDKHWTVVSKI